MCCDVIYDQDTWADDLLLFQLTVLETPLRRSATIRHLSTPFPRAHQTPWILPHTTRSTTKLTPRAREAPTTTTGHQLLPLTTLSNRTIRTRSSWWTLTLETLATTPQAVKRSSLPLNPSHTNPSSVSSGTRPVLSGQRRIRSSTT